MNNYSPERIQELREAFDVFDGNEDGRISCGELGEMMRQLGQNPTEAEILGLIEASDMDGSGFIEFNEFVEMFYNHESIHDVAQELRDAFRVFDKDGNGLISVRELRYALTECGERMTDEEVEELMMEADIDGDGHLNYFEFVKVMAQLEE